MVLEHEAVVERPWLQAEGVMRVAWVPDMWGRGMGMAKPFTTAFRGRTQTAARTVGCLAECNSRRALNICGWRASLSRPSQVSSSETTE